MKAICLDDVGPPENLKLVNIPIPEIDDDGILIKVDCAGLTYADSEFRRGTNYLQTALPYFPGREVAANKWMDSGKVMGKIAFKI
jgi:NADPH2:quinone reductase